MFEGWFLSYWLGRQKLVSRASSMMERRFYSNVMCIGRKTDDFVIANQWINFNVEYSIHECGSRPELDLSRIPFCTELMGFSV